MLVMFRMPELKKKTECHKTPKLTQRVAQQEMCKVLPFWNSIINYGVPSSSKKLVINNFTSFFFFQFSGFGIKFEFVSLFVRFEGLIKADVNICP